MNLQEFYQGLLQKINKGTLQLDPEFGDGVLLTLLFAVEVAQIENCSIVMQTDQVVIDGTCYLADWNAGERFTVRILCREQAQTIAYQASFWSDFQGTLGVFFGEAASVLLMQGKVAPTMVATEDGTLSMNSLVADFPVSHPVITFDSDDSTELFPLRFSASTKMPEDDLWQQYDFLLSDVGEISGRLDRDCVFELEVPVASVVTGIFSCAKAALLLRNGGENEGDIENPVISQVGLKLSLVLPQINEVDFTVPLFSQKGHWSLHTYFSDGLGILDIVNLMLELFHAGGSISALSLPTDTVLNQFKLYQIDLLVKQEALSLSMEYLMMELALAEPWKLPIPYVTLERLGVGFQVTFGEGVGMGNLITASAGGTLSVMLGSYKLTMDLEMDLPELSFIARTKLEKPENTDELENTDQPGISELADTYGVTLPDAWRQQKNLLGEITVYGSGSDRSYAIEAGVYDVLSFSIGDLAFSLQSVEAGAEISTSHFTFFVQGMMEFGEDEDAFIIYLNAAYENPGWVFAGGLQQGEINIGQLLSKMFQIENPAKDIFSLSISELDISYATEKGKFDLTAAFEANWNISLLGKDFILGGRIQVSKEETKETDVSALAYITLGDFKLLAQVDHVQREQDRSFLFRLEYDQLYLQAAWFHRNTDEILSVTLGGMTLGGLMESLVNMINPNKRYTLSAPWNLLNKIELSKFLLELNVTQNQVYFLYQAKLNIAGLMYIENVGVRYSMNEKKLFFVLTGKLLGITYDEGNPITWDVIDGQPPANSADNEKKFALSYLGMGQHLKNDGVAEADSIEAAVKALKEQLNSSSIAQGISYDAGTNWLFGADFTVNEMLNVKIVLNDPILYGLLVTVNAKQGSALAALDGFGMELLCKKVSSDVYMFKGELLVPKKYRTINLGAVSLTLGTIQVEVYTNGGFYVDLGFPSQMDFSRSFVLEWSVFTGRGGIYFGVMKNVSVPNLPAVTNGNFSPIVTLGIGLSVGLGRSFNFGIVKGGVSAEVFGIFEGVLAIFHDKDTQKESTYYYVKAVAGITGRLYLSVDFKIITVQASAGIQASAALTMQAYKASLVELNLALKLEASVKILFVKIKFSFSFEKKVTFTIGKNEQAPWIEEGAARVLRNASLYKIKTLSVADLNTEQIQLSLIPFFYLSRPSLDANAPKQFGVAFLMMMDQSALIQWTGLLADWVLTHFPENTVTAQQAEGLSPNLADTMTYAVLEEFLAKNAVVSYDIHWVEEEQCLQDSMEETPERFVFPMLPSLAISFGEEGKEQQVNYWEAQPVSQDYFDMLTDYFQQLNPDPSQTTEETVVSEGQNAQDGTLPIAKAFFQDYFRMFLREVIGRLQRTFEQLTTESGVHTAAQNYGLSVEEILRQNTELIFESGTRLVFPEITYITMESDTLGSICDKFSCDRTELWQSTRHETFLLQTGSTIVYGEGEFKNEISQFTLEQAAAFLFVRFYETLVPSDMFYAGDIVRLNKDTYEELDMDWQETQPGGHALTLPDNDGVYYTMRGDTPERISRYLNLLQMDKRNFAEWQEFYQDICERNAAQTEQMPSVVRFSVPQVLVSGDIDLAALADRLYPDCQQELPDTRLYDAAILKINTPITIPNAIYQIPDTGEMTVAMLLDTMFCTVEELGQAVSADTVFCEGQQLRLAGVQQMDKEELRRLAEQEADIIGAMLSRFLLQGLTIPSPDTENAEEAELLPLYQVLQQMFLLGDGQEDRSIKVVAGEPGCTWVETSEKQRAMSWEQIAKRLPDGDFSVVPSVFSQMEAFVPSVQYFTLRDSAMFYRGQERLCLYAFSDAMQEILNQGQASPALLDENGAEQTVTWGCLLPLTVGLCKEAGIFTVYGADARKRLVLHQILSLSNISAHILYQTSGVSKGGQSFWECGWSLQESFLAKTNLSVETHMSFLRSAGNGQTEETSYIVELDRTNDLLRMLWECSTVGGGGYYLQLKTADGQTLPDDIFDEQGLGTLWLLVQGDAYTALPGCVNCCILPNVLYQDSTMTLVTKDALQEKPQPVFPVGCVGLSSEMTAPAGEEDLSENDEYMRSLFQITGYQIMEGTDYEKSHISAPLLPKEENNMWYYQAVVPMYRYVPEQLENGEENPYLAVGRTGRIALELRDVLGNTVEIGETEITPYYNDILIGIGQYPAAKVSYALAGEEDAPVLRLVFHSVLPENPEAEAIKYQKRAAMQLACEDIRVTLSSPVNDEIFSFSDMQENNKSYLELLRAYVNSLADAMEGKGTVPEIWWLDFPLHMDAYPLPARIFELKTLITVMREESLAPEPVAQRTVSEVFPSAVSVDKTTEEQEKNLLEFCHDAQKALKNLYFAQRAEGDTILYGITYGENGFLKKLDVELMTYSAATMDGGQETVQAPEYYAFSPLYHGFLSRSATVRTLSEALLFSDTFSCVNFSDVDMELWANQFLEDVEALLLSGQVKKAGIGCRDELDKLITAKEQLARAIGGQLRSLRQAGGAVSAELKEMVTDRLKRSLTDGYCTDVAAVCQLCFETQEDERCRLSVVAKNDMPGTQAVAGKAESGKEEILLFFTNTFTGKSIPFETNLLFTELEYDIEKENDGYESSKWLRFVEPVRLVRENQGQNYDLESRIALPNPLRVCPQPPVLETHTCEMDLAQNGVEALIRSVENVRISWDYSLKMKYRYREQDTFYIRIVFESIHALQKNEMQRDLFDVLAEYTLNRDNLWQVMAEEEGGSEAYKNAYTSFVSIVCEAAAVWGSWVSNNRKDNVLKTADGGFAYSCTAEGIRTEEGLSFRLASTKEGQAFLKTFGLENRLPYIEVINPGSDTEETALKFVMQQLPLFSCAQAEPSVRIVRNQNLLSGVDFELVVREDFIYRTQDVSLPILPVTGEYTEEYKIATIPARTITQQVMEQAVSALYNALQLDYENLMAELSVSYYYGLDAGKAQPRVLLPVTLIPCKDTLDMQGSSASFIEELAENLYQWYQKLQPDTNACGLLFDVKIYQSSKRKLLLHFAGLDVSLDGTGE